MYRHRHIERLGQTHDIRTYENFLREIGYLVDEGANFNVTTANIDPEIGSIAGPQLVVPLNNARYALNAANARWGSLYDALYGTDVLPEDRGATKGSQYNPVRGTRVVAYVSQFLDQTVPLEKVRHDEVTTYQVNDGMLNGMLANGDRTRLVEKNQFAGYSGTADDPTSILFRHHGLHIELQIDFLL